jgi:galactokinase
MTANETAEFPIDREVPKGGPAWALYAKGAVEGIRRRVNLSRGFHAVMASSVPLGGGLSSSASFEVATAMALLAVNGLSLPLPEIALACQWGEHHYPGMPCGIMDQFISAAGKKGHAMLLDCRDHSTRHVPMDDDNLRVVICNSNVKHALVGGEYKKRREQCQEALAVLRKADARVSSLRDATLKQLKDSRDRMDRLPYRRALHVVTEIERTLDFADALAKRDYGRCGVLMYASHDSLRHDFEVSCAELDALVDIARQVPGVYGARMTGGGFGGCIVALCTAAAAEVLGAVIDVEYPKRFAGKQATTFSTVASAGASVE